MTEPRQLILLRHGQTVFNAGDRMQGQLDTELSELGRTQAVAAANILAARSPQLIVSSDLTRASETALVLGDVTGLEVRLDPRLRETHLGQWQGLTHHEVDAQAPGARAAWRADATWAPPGGENRIQVAARAVPVLQELLMDLPDWGARPVVFVAHGGLIAALTAASLRLPVGRWPVLGGLGNASWVQLSAHGDPFADGWRLDVWNASAQVANDVL